MPAAAPTARTATGCVHSRVNDPSGVGRVVGATQLACTPGTVPPCPAPPCVGGGDQVQQRRPALRWLGRRARRRVPRCRPGTAAPTRSGLAAVSLPRATHHRPGAVRPLCTRGLPPRQHRRLGTSSQTSANVKLAVPRQLSPPGSPTSGGPDPPRMLTAHAPRTTQEKDIAVPERRRSRSDAVLPALPCCDGMTTELPPRPYILKRRISLELI